LVRAELQRRGWKGTKKNLPRLFQWDKSKVALARRLRQEMTISLKWIAQRLQMGGWDLVFSLLCEK